LPIINGITRTIGTVNNAIGTATSVIGAVANTANAIGNLTNSFSGVDSGSAIGAWIDQLSVASWRGLPFGVDSTQDSAGRRVAVHTYPYRPDVWAEDMGQAPSSFSLSGFVVGDDCYAQAMAIRNASMQAGSGTLVHPWLGTFTVAQTTPPKVSVRKDLGRVVQIDFEFVQTGSSVYPSVVTDTGGAIENNAAALDDSAASSFAAQIFKAAPSADVVST
jgi:prophage DNA circulation protein